MTCIKLQGACSNPKDNPIATSGGASGVILTPRANGVLQYNQQLYSLGPYRYQVCIRFADDLNFFSTGLQVEVLQNYALRFVAMPHFASRSDVSFATVTVRLELESQRGVLVPYFDSDARPYASSVSTRVVLHLFRCKTTCGTLLEDLRICSEPCDETQWENVTHSLTGNDAPISGGAASYSQLRVNSNAGRFYLKAGWVRDNRLTWGKSIDFVVLPYRIETVGIRRNDQYKVQSVPREPALSFQLCDLGILPTDDVRCRGNAFLSPVTVRLLDIRGKILNMLKEHDAIRVVARLVQGTGGVLDVNHTFMPFPGDLIISSFLETGGLRENDTISQITPGGLANWTGTHHLQVRRQAGSFFQIHFSILGDSSGRTYLKINSESFAVLPAIVTCSEWSFGAVGNRPQAKFPVVPGRPRLVELPEITIKVMDGSGFILNHATCDSCVSVINEALAGNTCDYFGIRSSDPACEDPTWTIVDGICEFGANVIAVGEVSLEVCKDMCSQDKECLALNFYPLALIEGNVQLSSTCYIVRDFCNEGSSRKEGQIYYKPLYRDLGLECRCPKEEYDGGLVYNTMYSPKIAAGTSYVAAQDINQGVASVRGLYTVYRNGVSFYVVIKMRGIPVTVTSKPLVLVDTPGRLSYEPISPPEGACACAARPGAGIVALSSLDQLRINSNVQCFRNESSNQSTFEAACRDVEPLPSLHILSALEMKAMSCICTYEQLNVSRCMGCCRDLCWYG